MTNREHMGHILTALFEFMRDHYEPTADEVRAWADKCNELFRKMCGDTYPALPLSGSGDFYHGDK